MSVQVMMGEKVLALNFLLCSIKFFKKIKNGPNPASFCLFRPFLNTITNTVENLTQTPGDRMVGADESTEL